MRPLVLIASSMGGRECVPPIANGLSETDASIVCIPHISEEAIKKAIKDAVFHKIKKSLNYAELCDTKKSDPIIVSNEHRGIRPISRLIEDASNEVRANLILIIGPGSRGDCVDAISTVLDNGGNVFALTELPEIEYFQIGNAAEWSLEMPNEAVKKAEAEGLRISTGSIEDIIRDTSTLLHHLAEDIEQSQMELGEHTMEYQEKSKPTWTDQEMGYIKAIEDESQGKIRFIERPAFARIPKLDRTKYNEKLLECVDDISDWLLRSYEIEDSFGDSFEDHDTKRRPWKSTMEQKYDWFATLPWYRCRKRLNYLNNFTLPIALIIKHLSTDTQRKDLIERVEKGMDTLEIDRLRYEKKGEEIPAVIRKWEECVYTILAILATPDKQLPHAQTMVDTLEQKYEIENK